MSTSRLRIGTRGSKLALWQAHYVAEKLHAAGATTEIVTIETKGDKILDQALSKIGGKGLFTEELEEGLRHGEIDLAVHSAKDMPATLPEDLPIIAFTEREAMHDVLVSLQPNHSLESQPTLTIGTSSVRRTALLRHFFPQCHIVNLRGNLQTRMRKLEDGHCDALMLAYAGVHRMEYAQHITMEFPTQTFTPAVGQGSLAIQVANTLNPSLKALCINTLKHPTAHTALTTERAFLKTLQGGCSIPAFGLAEVKGQQIHFTAGVISLNGSSLIRKAGVAALSDAEPLGNRIAQDVLDAGGAEILAEIRDQKHD